ncbi:helix-turn-helix domain-containing protein, partial [Streptomyces sp. NPDC127079]|uniref:helix-turn-helix domain-containing protein n=1 Tax=Streptomyces sp. NPDC127079 TaxID=3347132 RepID=UPI0036551534
TPRVCPGGAGGPRAPAPDGSHPRVEAAFQRILTDSRWTGTGAPSEGGGAIACPPGEDRAVEAGAAGVSVAHGSAARELALCSLEEVVLLAVAGAHRAPDERDGRVRRAEELIAADPGAPHTVGTLAARVSLSPSRFAHLFTQQTGTSPMRAVREARLRHAARLLESTDLTVERIAAASGFPSPFHFNRVFRESHGVPPGAYRSAERL